MPTMEWICQQLGLNYKLVKLKIKAASNDHRRQIEQQTAAIYTQNIRNLNHEGVHARICTMEVQKVDEYARSLYLAYSDALKAAGKRKSATSVRTVRDAVILPAIRARGNALSSESAHRARRTGSPIGPAKQLSDSMEQLEKKWHDRLEVEALEIGEADHASSAPTSENQHESPENLESFSKGVREGKTISSLYVQLKRVRNLYRNNGWTSSQIRTHTDNECTLLWEWVDRINDAGKKMFLKVSDWDDGDQFIFLQIVTLYGYAPHLTRKPTWSVVRDWRKAYKGYLKYGTSDGRKPRQ